MTDPSEAIHLTLVRHGQSVSNQVKRWQGQGDSPLSARGQRQAARLGRRLQGRAFDRVFSSDLQRAADTAAALERSVEQHACFREFDVGAYEGLTQEEVQASFPEEMAALARGEDIPMGGGETRSGFAQRVDDALRFACEGAEPGARILIVCHGGFIAGALGRALGLRVRRDWPLARVNNTSITELCVLPGERHALEVFNDDLHLAEDRDPPSAAGGHEVGFAVGGPGDDLEHLAPWLEPTHHAYDLSGTGALPGWLAERACAPLEALEGLRSEARRWLLGVASRHAQEAVACVTSPDWLQGWAEQLVWGVPGAPASDRTLSRVGAARAGSWARARIVGEQVVLDGYNTDPRR